MPINQARKQNNALDEWCSGGVTKNPSFFQKWMLAGPEHAQLLLNLKLSTHLKLVKSILIMKKGFHNTNKFQAANSWFDRNH